MKATNEHFRCDLCGRFSNLGVTETYAVDPKAKPGDIALLSQNTVCVRCISNATALLLGGLIAVGEPAAET